MLLASGAFYLLIAFEFFYMASPFAAYFYAVYGPGLDGLQAWGLSGWMLWFFLPHIVAETKSALINITPVMGLLLFFGGLLGFAGGAFQVYRAKIRKQGAVTGGLYRYIRHPQYTALIIASLGMLLIWPRFLVLYSTIAMVFAYAADLGGFTSHYRLFGKQHCTPGGRNIDCARRETTCYCISIFT